MKELSLHIMDIAQNSVAAGAKNIEIRLEENSEGKLIFTISDDGCGMDEKALKEAKNPFVTSRTTRKVGLGIPLLTLAAEQTGGYVTIESKPKSKFPNEHGTKICAVFDTKHIDFIPLGDIASTVSLLIYANPNIDFIFEQVTPKGSVKLSTVEMRKTLGAIPLNDPEVAKWIKEYLNESCSAL